MTDPRALCIRLLLTAGLLVSSLVALAPDAAAEKLPKTSHDGLVLMEHTKLRAVYMKPGASLDQYKRIALLDCAVAFKKNWQRDHNFDSVGLDHRVSKKDMEKIKTRLAAEFKKIFTRELEKEGGYEIVTDAAEDVLVLRPAIIDLDVTAPDTMSPDMSTSYVASAGSMTLYLELYDSVTSSIIARVIDPEAARSMGEFDVSSSVTNTAAADRILARWADILRSHLGDLHERGKD